MLFWTERAPFACFSLFSQALICFPIWMNNFIEWIFLIQYWMNNFIEWIFLIQFWIEYWIESFFGPIQHKNEYPKPIAAPYLYALSDLDPHQLHLPNLLLLHHHSTNKQKDSRCQLLLVVQCEWIRHGVRRVLILRVGMFRFYRHQNPRLGRDIWRKVLVEGHLSLGLPPLRNMVLSRFSTFYQHLLRSPCAEVSVLAKLMSKDTRSTTAGNLSHVSATATPDKLSIKVALPIEAIEAYWRRNVEVVGAAGQSSQWKDCAWKGQKRSEESDLDAGFSLQYVNFIQGCRQLNLGWSDYLSIVNAQFFHWIPFTRSSRGSRCINFPHQVFNGPMCLLSLLYPLTTWCEINILL